MVNLFYKLKKFAISKTGSVSTEQMIFLFIALTIGTVAFIFRSKVVEFIENATNRLGQDDFKLT